MLKMKMTLMTASSSWLVSFPSLWTISGEEGGRCRLRVCQLVRTEFMSSRRPSFDLSVSNSTVTDGRAHKVGGLSTVRYGLAYSSEP